MSSPREISVVIIESSEIVRERIVDLVSRLVDTVILGIADTGAQGLELCGARQPDAVMVGLELQDMNGMKFLQQLRKAQPACRIVALTNCPFKGIIQLSLECGADFCFDKTREFQRALEVCQELADRGAEQNAPAVPPGGGATEP